MLVLGVDALDLISDAYDRSDLFRFGGASTLRGYDEERFFAATAGRALAEYRYQLDVRSYAYVFLDVGYVNVNWDRAWFDDVVVSTERILFTQMARPAMRSPSISSYSKRRTIYGIHVVTAGDRSTRA